MPDTAHDQEQILLKLLTEAFRRVCERANAQIFIEQADKHGSLVWEAGWEQNGARYLTLAATEYLAGTWHIEIWAAAADDRAYTREITTEHTLLIPTSRGEVTIPPSLDDELWASVTVANSVHPGDPDVIVLPADRHTSESLHSVPTSGPAIADALDAMERLHQSLIDVAVIQQAMESLRRNLGIDDLSDESISKTIREMQESIRKVAER